MDSKAAYTALVVLVGALRLLEVRISHRNIARLKARGAVERGLDHYPWMVAIHSGWLVCCVAEVWMLDRPFIPMLAVPMGVAFSTGMALRYWAITTLGKRWSTRVVAIPGLPLVESGPYRIMRHPNYLGVVLELAALPLIHTAWLTATAFTAAFAGVLRRRIRVEEALLAETTGREGTEATRRLGGMES